MKKTIKKLTAVGLTLTSVMSLVACGNQASDNDNDDKEQKETIDWASVQKPGKFTIMVDNTVVTEANGGPQFYEYLAELTGLEFEWLRPDHTKYYDQVASKFASGEYPDVIVLSSDYLALYAANGVLWDMTDAWENSATKASGRLVSVGEDVMQGNTYLGPDGEKHLYGFSPARGNGCCTYIKKKWLDKAGIDVSTVKDKTLTYDEYYDILKKLKASTDSDYVISAPSFISKEAPYTNYLPEFYQNAQYTFYYDEAAKEYKDGFSQQAMKDALQRIQNAVKDGIINPESEGQGTSNARDRFYSTEPKSESGVFTYWAGNWANTMTTKVKDTLIALYPIKELGVYTERIAPAWAITTHAGDKAPGIYKYFLDTMLDGDKIQVAWQYGAKGTHWDDKAETVTLKDGTEKGTYEEGQFHFLPKPEGQDSLMSKNHIDPALALTTFKDKDPGAKEMAAVAKENSEMFLAHSKVATPLVMTETVGNNIGAINEKRNELISKVALNKMTVDEAMKEYQDTQGSKVEACLKSLNEIAK